MADEKQNTEAVVADPYSMTAKRQLHEKADEKNFIELRHGKPILCCGARKKKTAGFCRSRAGAGTDHPGYGRCKFCFGNAKGPKTEEGKKKASQNSRIHGLYASALDNEEVAIYDEMAEQKVLGLEHEIYFLKAKIIRYLRNFKNKAEKRRAAVEGTINGYEWYTAGTIDDRPLMRALETLGRLVEKHSRLTQDSGEDLLSSINKELQQASQGKVSISWGGKPQTREEAKDE